MLQTACSFMLAEHARVLQTACSFMFMSD
jgi:hypothetical protein